MDYGLLPPEINSGRMYTGPGSGTLRTAAAAWTGLAADLQDAASGLRSVICWLTSEPWLGPTAASLAAAATPHARWLERCAENSELMGTQAAAAADAYDAAFAMTVPPAVIAANRVLVAHLIATNILGQNTPAIATAEAAYFEMWAVDATAMYGYASSSAAAARLPYFAEPAQIVNPGGLISQEGAVASTVGHVVQSSQDVVTNLSAQLSGALRSLSTAQFGNLKPIDDWLVNFTPIDDVASMYSRYVTVYLSSVQMGVQSTQATGQLSNAFTALNAFSRGGSRFWTAAAADQGAAQALGAARTVVATNSAGVTATMGKALPLGHLSVPPHWAPVNAVTNPALAAITNPPPSPLSAEGLNTLPMAPLGQFAGSQYGRSLPSYGFKPSVMAKPPAAG